MNSTSWKAILEKNSNNVIKKKKKINHTPIVEVDTYEDIENNFNYKYGDRIFDDIFKFYEENEHDNLILKSVSPSFLYEFFMEYVDKERYYEPQEEPESSSDSDDYSDQ